MSKFRRGTQPGGNAFDAIHLPENEKKQLCRSLLSEFEAQRVSETSTKELIHSCVLPFGLHANGDRHPSARLNWEKLTYNCSVCGGGGLLWFIAICRDTDSEEAATWLTSETGIGGLQELGKLLSYLDSVFADQRRVGRVSMPRMDMRVIEKWQLIHPYLTDPPPDGRGIPEQNVIDLNVGFDPDRYRITIPHLWKGNLVGWQSRRLRADGSPKYLSTPEFPKDDTIYCFEPSRRTVVVVESPMSVIAKLHVAPEMEATFGAKVTDRQVRLLAEHDRVILWMDNDIAGWSATESMVERLMGFCEVWVVDSDLDADPADLPDDEVRRYIDDGFIPASLWRRPEYLRELEPA